MVKGKSEGWFEIGFVPSLEGVPTWRDPGIAGDPPLGSLFVSAVGRGTFMVAETRLRSSLALRCGHGIRCPAVSRMTKSTSTTPSIHAVAAPSSGACAEFRRILALMLVVCCLGSLCRPDVPSVGHEKMAGIQGQEAITGITPGTPGDSSFDAPLLWEMVETPDQDRAGAPPCRSAWWWGNRPCVFMRSLGGELLPDPSRPVDAPGRLLIRQLILQTALL